MALHVSHYNFVWVHGRVRMTSVMAAGIVDELWTIEDLYDALMAGGAVAAA